MAKPDTIYTMQPRMVRLPKPLWKRLKIAAIQLSVIEGRRVTAAEIIRRGTLRELAEWERAA